MSDHEREVSKVNIEKKEEKSNNDTSEEQNSKENESVSRTVLEEIQNMAQDSINFIQSIQIQQLPDDPSTRQESSKYIPGPLQPSGIAWREIQHHLEELILQLDDDSSGEKSGGFELRQLDEIGKMAVISHTLAAYVSTLEPWKLRRLATRIVSDTTLWISRLFRFFDTSAYFHDESKEGLIRVCRMILHTRYPKYMSEGSEALYARPPVIYVSAAARPGLGQYICTQLGLPLGCLATVPCNTVFGSQYKMDIAALEKLIQEDVAAARKPLLMVANAGSPAVGHVDNLPRLQELCKLHDIWLHIEGHSIAGLCLVSVPSLPARIGDSMTLPIGSWFGVPSLPCVTLYKAGEPAWVHAAGLSSFNLNVRLNCLPIWVILQSLGHEGAMQRIKFCFELSDYLLEKLEEMPHIRIIAKERMKSNEGKTYSITDVISKSISTTLLFDILAPVVVFQYIAENRNQKSAEKELTEEFPAKNPAYFDNLNSWLGQVLRRDVPTVKLDIIDLEQHGICIRICPLESSHITSMTKEDVDEFHNCLQQQLEILNATVRQKETFRNLVENQKNLQIVEISNWAGLGGVRYIPDSLVDKLNQLTEEDKDDINKLNSEVVVKLKATDSAFSLGEGDDTMLCVRFGMVTDDLDMEELVNLVLTSGQELEESSKFIETMSEMVRQGIEEANKELEQENIERIMQEGVIRHVPIVGSLVNWWSPVSKETGIKGRSFNLTSGIVESTENIYKYHMQIQQGSNSPRTPPPSTKSVVGSKLERNSQQHSRSSSHSSQSASMHNGNEIKSNITQEVPVMNSSETSAAK
ncbi:putative pyridoxal-dependent decarboxylase domain-containing protein 2 isoform X1 [Centruroides sculpturatus]|uniref:putative pyridoxal-dependent decarboxylase domain-containing protein 2 isoform X1 n=1 Tax=Centruroides sculpturatus TaxID=218467 RepID=UPI000C6EF5D1|nr:putative pyridoxal-dependent decarboxylase domain-containing protein 2 isoform X1 [Centruroides sculpturatus]XP_023239037.1 putative pyridoxal-dependent decarboxylase domain-containing protein 2 isoform X2 [Centruroides sculpturatus]XP_023239038.1 putative pyridoxal-dependent decarboxylase domain-containing protein 2 isoform X1 [Centruroides sculpturatus]